MLVGVRLKGARGSRAERVMEQLPRIAADKHTAPGDMGALVPGSLQMCGPTLAGRDCVENELVGAFIIQCAPSIYIRLT